MTPKGRFQSLLKYTTPSQAMLQDLSQMHPSRKMLKINYLRRYF
jgi:hypothetical protein